MKLWHYLSFFSHQMFEQLISDERRWKDTWRERGLVWNEKTQEQRFIEWVNEKYAKHQNGDPMPWVKIACEALIGFVRENFNDWKL